MRRTLNDDDDGNAGNNDHVGHHHTTINTKHNDVPINVHKRNLNEDMHMQALRPAQPGPQTQP